LTAGTGPKLLYHQTPGFATVFVPV
jgi:hypothetical protein